MFEENEVLNPYDILGLQPKASLAEIKKAFRQKARENHPDAHRNKEDKVKADKEFKKLLHAYQSLQDETQKKFWDEGGRGGGRMSDGPAMQARWAAARRMKENRRSTNSSQASARPLDPEQGEGELNEILRRHRRQRNTPPDKAMHSNPKAILGTGRWRLSILMGSALFASAYYFARDPQPDSVASECDGR